MKKRNTYASDLRSLLPACTAQFDWSLTVLDALRSTLPRLPDALTLTTVTVTLLRLIQLLYSTAPLQFVRFYVQLTLTGADVLTRMYAGSDSNFSRASSATL
jgi:hypothetical protein